MEDDWNEDLLNTSDGPDFTFERNRKRSVDDDDEINLVKKKIQQEGSHNGHSYKKFKGIRHLAAQEEHSTWSLEDDAFFYPFGICNHGIDGAHKSVIITWSEYTVINFVIKKMVNKKQTKTMRVRLNVPKEEKIKDIIILDYNTLLLLESGCVNYFSSAKSMHYLHWLKGVRCIGKTINGFCVIRLTSDRKLSLEVFEDAVNMGKMDVEPKQQYDITFDERNIFNCNLEDEHFLVFAVTVEEDDKEFLEQLTQAQLLNTNEIFVFSVSGSVFVLVPDSDDNDNHNIQIMFSYASNVKFIKIDQKQRICLIYLECGKVDIWYLSPITKKFLHQMDYTGAGCTNYTYSDSRRSFFFVDELQVVEARFTYDQLNDRFSVRKISKSLSGVLACTWIESINQLVCLDCNNIFHQLEFEDLTFEDDLYENTYKNDKPLLTYLVDDIEKHDSLLELTSDHVLKLNQKSSIIQQLRDLPKQMYIAIENEYVKQELLTINNRRKAYSRQFTAHLKFSRHLCKDFETNFLNIGTGPIPFCGYEELQGIIKLKTACKDIFKNSVWQLYVKCGDSMQILSLPRPLKDDEISLIIPLKRNISELLPNIQLYLYSFICQSSEYIPLSIPITLSETLETYRDLIMPIFNPAQNVPRTHGLEDLFAQLKNQTIITNSPGFEHHIIISNNVQLKDIFDMLKISCDRLMPFDEVCEIKVLNSIVTMSSDKGKGVLSIKSGNAASLFYVKFYLLLACTEKKLNGFYKLEDHQQMIMRNQCNIESGYRIFEENGDRGSLSPYQVKTWQKFLIQTYEKIRKFLLVDKNYSHRS